MPAAPLRRSLTPCSGHLPRAVFDTTSAHRNAVAREVPAPARRKSLREYGVVERSPRRRHLSTVGPSP